MPDKTSSPWLSLAYVLLFVLAGVLAGLGVVKLGIWMFT